MRIGMVCAVYLGASLALAPDATAQLSNRISAAPLASAHADSWRQVGGKSSNLPEIDETTPIEIDPNALRILRFNAWVLVVEYTPFSALQRLERCVMELAAEGRDSIFQGRKHLVSYSRPRGSSGALHFGVPRLPHRDGAPVAQVGRQVFRLARASPKLVVPEPKAQGKMMEALRTGQTMVVTWTEADGTRWEDRYHLAGMSQAMAEMSRLCS